MAHNIKENNNLARRRLTRLLWIIAGVFCVIIAAIGIILPLLPTTPFLLLTAYCFARGSSHLNHWLMTHPHFGPPILNWQKYGAISRSAKAMALIALAAIIPASWVFGAPDYTLVIQAVVVVCSGTFIVTRPVPPGCRTDA